MYAPNQHSSILACSSSDNPTNGARTLLLDKYSCQRVRKTAYSRVVQIRRCEDTRTACQGSHDPVSEMLNRRKKQAARAEKPGQAADPPDPAVTTNYPNRVYPFRAR